MNKQDPNSVSPNAADPSLHQLRAIILAEDRPEIASLQSTLHDQKKLAELVDPIVMNHIADLKRNYPTEFKVAVNSIIEDKLKSSQNEIIDVIYPKLGLLIRKFILQQIQELKDKIDAQVQKRLSFGRWWKNFKLSFFGMKSSDIAINDLNTFVIEQIFVIQKNSGLLIANAELGEVTDEESIAGMLTAIKAFAEDAFDKEKQDLEMIKYNNFSIYLNSIGSFYYATVFSGNLSNTQGQLLDQELLRFSPSLSKHLAENDQVRAAELIEESLKTQIIDKFASN